MNKEDFHLLDDQPVSLKKADKLHFTRYLEVIKKYLLKRKETTPFVFGIYGKWGTGKTTLLEMLAEKLKEDEKWITIKFSPWMYRNEKSLLLPLLATISKKTPAFEKLVKKIISDGPAFIKTLSSMGLETATTGLPLLTFLQSIKKKSKTEEAKDLAEKIENAVKEATKNGKKKMVFLIDDLDRCHDPLQIINLLEQIKIFLHLDHCLFVLSMDKDQVITAVEEKFPKEGASYLDKFVQLDFELPPTSPTIFLKWQV